MRRFEQTVPFLFLGVGQAVTWAGLYYLFPALMLSWEREEGWARTPLTLIFMIAVVASSLLSPLMGAVIDRGGSRWLLAGSAGIGGAFLIALSLIDGWPAFAVIWALIGVTMAGALYEPCFAIIVRYAGKEAPQAIATVTLIAGFASTLCFPIATSIAASSGWRWAAGSAGVAILAIGAPLLWLGVKSLQAGHAARPVPVASTYDAAADASLRRPALWLLASAFSLFALVHAGVLNHLLPILADQKANAGLSILAASLIGPMQVVGRLGMIFVQRRLPPLQITAWVFAGLAAASLALLFARGTPALVIVFVVLQGVSVGLSSILKPVVAAALLGTRNFGAVTGAMAVPYLAAFAAAPFLASLIWSWWGYDVLLAACAATAAVGLVLYRVAVASASHS